MEMTTENQRDRDRFAEEAAGQRRGGAPPDDVKASHPEALSEHPQGIAIEIIMELDRRDIDQHAIAAALGALLRGKKLSLRERGGKYIPTAAEVPTGPDQPSSWSYPSKASSVLERISTELARSLRGALVRRSNLYRPGARRPEIASPGTPAGRPSGGRNDIWS